MPVLDTNLLIRASMGDAVAGQAFATLARRGDRLLVPAIAAAEFLVGESAKAEALRWCREAFTLVHTNDDHIVEAATMYATARAQGDRRPAWPDLLIAAVARVEGTFVVTTNKRDFTRLGVPAWHYEEEAEPPTR